LYCGSTERTSAEEREPRGYNVVTFDDGVSVRRRGLDTRPFVFVDVELGPDEAGERVKDRLREEDLTDAVAIVTIEGEGDRVVPADIEAVGDAEGALVTRVNDRREIDAEGEPDVSFADPDAVVQDRVSSLGLSVLARDIDTLIRDEEVPDSTLRDRVVDRVEDAAEEAASFEPAADQEPDDETTDRDRGESVETADMEAPPRDPEETDASGEDRSAEGDEQVSMEEYL
jgi:exonuclease SbcD